MLLHNVSKERSSTHATPKGFYRRQFIKYKYVKGGLPLKEGKWELNPVADSSGDPWKKTLDTLTYIIVGTYHRLIIDSYPMIDPTIYIYIYMCVYVNAH